MFSLFIYRRFCKGKSLFLQFLDVLRPFDIVDQLRNQVCHVGNSNGNIFVQYFPDSFHHMGNHMIDDAVGITSHILCLIPLGKLHNSTPASRQHNAYIHCLLHRSVNHPICVHIKWLKFEILFPYGIVIDPIL